MLPQFEIFGRTIGTYGLCSIVGLIICAVVASLLAKKYKYDYMDIILLMLSAAGGLLVGSHIMYGISNIDKVTFVIMAIGKASFIKIIAALAECFGGMVFYGGFLGGIVGIAVYSKFSKIVEYKNAIDLYAVVVPLFHCFGRIGCFLGGCCYGKEWSWGIVFPENKFIPELAGTVRFPVQLIEAGCNLLIFLFLLYLFKKNITNKRLIFVYMLVYPVVRFILEFFRGDEIRGIFFGISTSQWVSIILFVCAITYFIMPHIKSQKNYRNNKNQIR